MTALQSQDHMLMIRKEVLIISFCTLMLLYISTWHIVDPHKLSLMLLAMVYICIYIQTVDIINNRSMHEYILRGVSRNLGRWVLTPGVEKNALFIVSGLPIALLSSRSQTQFILHKANIERRTLPIFADYCLWLTYSTFIHCLLHNRRLDLYYTVARYQPCQGSVHCHAYSAQCAYMMQVKIMKRACA